MLQHEPPGFIRIIDACGEFFVSSHAIRETISHLDIDHPWRFIEDPDLTTSYDILKSVMRAAPDRPNVVDKALQHLMSEGGVRETDVEFSDISALSASKGRYIGNLKRLWATSDSVRFCELTSEKFAEIKEQVFSGSGCIKNERFNLIEECWSGRLIAQNSGTARRIAWLHSHHYLDRTPFPARKSEWALDSNSLHTLTEQYWLALLPKRLSAFQLSSQLSDLGLKCSNSHGSLFSSACPDEHCNAEWSVFSCEKSNRKYPQIRLNLLDSVNNIFDLSNWLSSISTGRSTP